MVVVRHRHRRHLPRRRAAVPGEAERAGAGGRVHPAQHRRDADGVRTSTTSRRSSTTPRRRRRRARCARTPRPRRAIRLLDPQIVSPSFRQLQQNKQYYNFPDSLSVDRYEIDGESRDTVIAVRELNLDGLGQDQRNWVNDHTVYTHGFGVVAAYGNQPGPDGRPAFFEGGIPSAGCDQRAGGRVRAAHLLRPESPTRTRSSALPRAAKPWELDYRPTTRRGGQVNTTFDRVDAGPERRQRFGSKLLYALKFGDEQLLFSDRVTSESQILYDRDPQRAGREGRAVPDARRAGVPGRRGRPGEVDRRRLHHDATPTRTPRRRRSTRRDRGHADRRRRRSGRSCREEVNYIRNSVKATVDAYDGSVDALRVGRRGPDPARPGRTSSPTIGQADRGRSAATS